MAGNNKEQSWLFITLVAAAVLMVVMGARQSLGLFVFPLKSSTGLGILTISFAMAINQFVWGAVQPIAGAAADRYGHGRVLVTGALIFALGNALTSSITTGFGLMMTLGLLSAVGSGSVSFAVLLGAVARRLSAEHRGAAAAVINAGSSFGQFVFAPLVQTLIAIFGWMGAMWSLAIFALATLPLIRLLPDSQASGAVTAGESRLGLTVKRALGNPSYWLLHAAFFTCGFHIAFLVTHLPGEVSLWNLPPFVASWSLAIIGLANIAGSLATGWLVSRYRSKHVLFWMYGSRALLILAYLSAPKTAWTFYLFGVGLGFTWLATVAPTASIIGKLFGGHYIATLFGLTLLSHQSGGFLGAWLGGLTLTYSGDYLWMWYADAVLAGAAALCNLPIRESRMAPRVVPA